MLCTNLGGLWRSKMEAERDIIPFQQQTEEQLLKRVDHSIAQIGSDECDDLEDVVAEMMIGIDG